MLAVLSPLMVADLSAPLCNTTDSSDAKGAIVSTRVRPAVARALWRTGRWKGCSHNDKRGITGPEA